MKNACNQTMAVIYGINGTNYDKNANSASNATTFRQGNRKPILFTGIATIIH